MAIGTSEDIGATTAVHRVGGGSVANLRPSALDQKQDPPGISTLLGGTPQEAADQMRKAFPRSPKWRDATHAVGTTTAGALRKVGFEIVPAPTSRFPNHARLIHPDGMEGFTDENLEMLAKTFRNTTEC